MPMGKEVKMVFFSNIQREMNFSVIPKKIITCKAIKECFPGEACEFPHETGAQSLLSSQLEKYFLLPKISPGQEEVREK